MTMDEKFTKPEELLKEYISYASVSADSAYADQLKGAREFVASLLETLESSTDFLIFKCST